KPWGSFATSAPEGAERRFSSGIRVTTRSKPARAGDGGGGADGRPEDPTLERHVEPVARRAVSHEHGATRQPGEAFAPHFLIKPGAIGGDAEPRLRGERRDERGERERQSNWKGVIGAARLHRSEYGKEAWAAHPGRLDRARRLGLPARPGGQRRRARRPAH